MPGLGQSDPPQFLAYLETVSAGVTKVGTETMRGVDTTHYHATLDLAKAVDRADVPPSLRDELSRSQQTRARHDPGRRVGRRRRAARRIV